MTREEQIKMNYLKRNSPMTALYMRDKKAEAKAAEVAKPKLQAGHGSGK